MSAPQVFTPVRIRALPVDRHRRPIPWFVHREPDGTPDFRVIRHDGLRDAHHGRLCWVCGRDRGQLATFVLGPMCAVNRVNSEPPSHEACAVYAVQACPFLTRPDMRRRDADLPPLDESTAGVAITRNPGVACVWTSRTWEPFNVPAMGDRPTAGVLWDVGDPVRVRWFARGRPASHAEVWAAIESGMPALAAAAELDGPAGIAQLSRAVDRVLPLLPRPPAGVLDVAATARGGAR